MTSPRREARLEVAREVTGLLRRIGENACAQYPVSPAVDRENAELRAAVLELAELVDAWRKQ